MNWKRGFRLFVCLLLVCALVVNISPIRAKAVSPMWVWIEASLIFASIMAGLGVSPTDEGADLIADTLTDCKNFITLNYDFVTDDERIAAWATGTDDLPYLVDQGLIEAVRDWLFSSGVLIEGGAAAEGYAWYNEYYLPEIPAAGSGTETHIYSVIFYSLADDCFYVQHSNNPYYRDSNGYYRVLSLSTYKQGSFRVGDATWSFSDVNNTFFSSRSFFGDYDLIWSNYDLYSYEDKSTLLFAASEPSTTAAVTTSEEYISLDYVAPLEVDFPTGYSTWSAGAISVPGIKSEVEVVVAPIAVGATVTDTWAMTQEDVWAGASAADVAVEAIPDTDTETETGTKTLADVIAAVKAIPQALGNTFTDVLSFLFVPSDGFIEGKFDDLRTRFSFVDSIMATSDYIKTSVSGGSGPPAIYVDFGLAGSDIYGGKKVLLTDFAWYEKYKGTVDTWLSAALWAFFFWRLFLRLPGIISGESGYLGEVMQHREASFGAKDAPIPGSSVQFGPNGDHAFNDWKSKKEQKKI